MMMQSIKPYVVVNFSELQLSCISLAQYLLTIASFIFDSLELYLNTCSSSSWESVRNEEHHLNKYRWQR